MFGYILLFVDFGFLLCDWLMINEYYVVLRLEDFDVDFVMEVVE